MPDRTYWHKQTADSALFPDMLWSRPENRAHAGKLLIVGGNLHGFAAPAEAYGQAIKAGVGSCRVMLPDSLHKTVGKLFPEAEFAPSTPSGSFARTALAELLAAANWADGVLLAGDFGKNSETAILLEGFLSHYKGLLVVTQDALDYCLSASGGCLTRPDTVIVVSTAQLRKLAVEARWPVAVTSSIDLMRLIDILHEQTSNHPCSIIVKHLENLLVASAGQISTTKLPHELPVWHTAAGATAAVWWLQNPAQPFQALSCAIHDIIVRS